MFKRMRNIFQSMDGQAGWADGDWAIFIETYDEPQRRRSGIGIAGKRVLAGILRDGTF